MGSSIGKRNNVNANHQRTMVGIFLGAPEGVVKA